MNKLDEAHKIILDAKMKYKFRLEESKIDRCFDCESIDIGFNDSGKCFLLNIAIANIKKSKCKLHSTESFPGKTYDFVKKTHN